MNRASSAPGQPSAAPRVDRVRRTVRRVAAVHWDCAPSSAADAAIAVIASISGCGRSEVSRSVADTDRDTFAQSEADLIGVMPAGLTLVLLLELLAARTSLTAGLDHLGQFIGLGRLGRRQWRPSRPRSSPAANRPAPWRSNPNRRDDRAPSARPAVGARDDRRWPGVVPVPDRRRRRSGDRCPFGIDALGDETVGDGLDGNRAEIDAHQRLAMVTSSGLHHRRAR